MAEAVFTKIAAENRKSDRFIIDSAGLLSYHMGEPADSRMRFFADKRGYHITHRSRPFTRSDFDHFDIIIGMDDSNIDGLKRLASTVDEKEKIHRMTDFCIHMNADHVPDPYYGGSQGFEYVIDLLEDACKGLFDRLSE